MEPKEDSGKRTKAESGLRVKESDSGTKTFVGEFVPSKNAPYFKHRSEIVQKILDQYKADYETAKKQQREISITMKMGGTTKTGKGKSFETSPMMAAKKPFKKHLKNILVCKVTYTKRDMLGLSVQHGKQLLTHFQTPLRTPRART